MRDVVLQMGCRSTGRWPAVPGRLADLAHEYRLVTRPVAVGGGEPMFHGLPVQRRLALVEATAYPDGTVISVHRRGA